MRDEIQWIVKNIIETQEISETLDNNYTDRDCSFAIASSSNKGSFVSGSRKL